MKLLFLLFIVAIIGIAIYFISSRIFSPKKKQKKFNWKPLGITCGVVVILLGLIAFGMHKSATAPDMQCTQIHNTNPVPPLIQTANGYLKLGDFYYDQGNCTKAITEYTNAIQLHPTFYQAYNNRAYTNMRLRNYKDALPDLDKAIQLNPNYIQALMNRGDIHNYYYQIDRQSAITDYKKAISLGATQEQTSACGHLFLAKHNGWTLGAYIGYFTGEWASCK